MARLPIIGGDLGTWGEVLNAFLLASHNSDGTVKAGSISDAQINDVSQSKVTGLSAAISAKEPAISLGTATQYYRGDKTWQTLATVATTGNYNDLSNKPDISGSLLPAGMTVPFAGPICPAGWLLCYGQSISRTTYSNLFNVLNPSIGSVTISIATPAVVTLVNHGLALYTSIIFETTGALPTGLSTSVVYIVGEIIDANNFKLATDWANAYYKTFVATSGSQSGTHTVRTTPYGITDGATFTLPDLRGNVVAGLDTMGSTAANRLYGATMYSVDGATLGAMGGEEEHTLDESEMPEHSHAYQLAESTSFYAGTSDNGSVDSAIVGSYDQTDYAGGSSPHNNVQPTIILNYIIKT